MRQGRWDDAVAALEEATAGDDVAPYMWNNLGSAYERRKELELARTAYEQGALGGSRLAAANLTRLEESIEHTAQGPDDEDDSSVE